MPDRRAHRGPHPQDAELFAPACLERLRAATHDLGWLLERGYRMPSALKLTGDRYALTFRQRAAVARCACAPSVAQQRKARMVESSELAGHALHIDGFNVLTTLEVALSGGVVLIGSDGTMRDIAGVHGSYRKVDETLPALELLRGWLRELSLRECAFWLDAPVSNSGRLCALIRELATHDLAWRAQVVADPDVVLAHSREVVATADGEILDAAEQSYNLARTCIERFVPGAFCVDLGVV